MSKTAVNHYVSQFIIRNFAPNGEQLYELDLKTGAIRPKSTINLFSGRRLWNQEIENKITKNVENDLARVIKKIRNTPLAEREELFQAQEVYDKSDCNILTRLMLQSGLFQSKNDKEAIEDYEKFIDNSSWIQADNQVFYVRIQKRVTASTPLVLIDNNMYICPVYVNGHKILAHVVFVYVISPFELILVAAYQDVMSFLHQHYYSVHEINMRSITQQNKECRIASANKLYLELIKETITSYRHESRGCTVTATREFRH